MKSVPKEKLSNLPSLMEPDQAGAHGEIVLQGLLADGLFAVLSIVANGLLPTAHAIVRYSAFMVRIVCDSVVSFGLPGIGAEFYA
ncbi:hypothetical protein [Azotobacter salinestris]|uniref:hypothetical protein n=1 Tax=Azotobacter salinestris TaxID=69964 RepID=UPI0032DE3188